MMIIGLGIGLSLMTPAQPSDGLRPLAEKLRLNLGAAVVSEYLRQDPDGGQYQKTVLDNYTMIEPENDLKPPALWQGVGKYDFSKPDFFVDWAMKHKMKVRGHVLLYASDNGYTIPRWLLNMEKEITPEQAKTMLHDYIISVAGRYKGKIMAWDVINEAIEDRPNSNPFNLRNSFWYRKLGVDFVELAFRFAHEADPKCKLYYNDYSVENGGTKADNLLKMADYLISKKVPIDGIGLQFHRWMVEKPVPGDKFYTMLAEIQKRKLSFMITEFDLSMPITRLPRTDPNFGLVPMDPEDLQKQAESYSAFVKMALSFKNCQGIQLWGVSDGHSWIPGSTGGRGAALLLDKDYKPKPAYTAFADALKGAHK